MRRWIENDEPEGAPDGFALGLHVPGRFDKVLDIRSCDIAFHEASALLNSTRELAQELGLTPWDVRAHEGLLRHLVLRKGFATGDIMLDLVTTERAPERVDPLARRLLERHPEITTLVQNVNPGVAMVATGVEEHVLHGSGRIEEQLLGLRFSVSANSFFQTNTRQAERLVEEVRGQVAIRAGEVLYDLYCGCGTFSLPLARDGARVFGFELVESAIEDARANAARNELEGLKFVAGDLAETLAGDAASGFPRPDVCIVDPPRAGMHPKVVRALAELSPRRIVYVSCNAKSAVRDVQLLVDAYRLSRDPTAGPVSAHAAPRGGLHARAEGGRLGL